ncbi:C3H1-type domain-containing protein [Caenorhabditis elegans]|uniref:C3H1-type domain-containing protein n=1 Tax=Caenorhabditis elegans TaxID=6239 RepID=Q9U2V2_CAEEL|nr:C3H1-type domain-containing protein [Caenorhabditis elegans]CAB55125.1 C3H1-type domain-containing protein [Caenorhabditis elegans]|eukprot:NP_503019.1 Uncharacterized protein CELE_Y116A8C.19 [Caenorhabditis elegans]
MSPESSNQTTSLSSFLLKCAFPDGTVPINIAPQSLSLSSSPGSYDGDQFSPLMKQHKSRKYDSCTISDDLHDEMKRLKKKEEAFKTALCGFQRRGQKCIYGEQCKFAHSVHELRFTQAKKTHRNYKTVLCDKFSTTGYCKYGARCQFIHRALGSTSTTESAEMADFKLNVESDLSRAFALDYTSFLPNWHCSALLH